MLTLIFDKIPMTQEDYFAKRIELFTLQAQLIDRECYLASLRSQLSAFESVYIRDVGHFYAELDEWNARIAELTAEIAGTQGTRTAAQEARNVAEESRAASVQKDSPPEQPTSDLKALYRRVAKRIHPDLATDEVDREERTLLMSIANTAFEQGDMQALQQALDDYDASSLDISSSDKPSGMDGLLVQAERLRERLARIEFDIVSLSSSELGKLMASVETRRTAHFAPLAHLASVAREKVRRARYEYSTLKESSCAARR